MGIAYLRGPASRAGRLGKNCRPRARARQRGSPNTLNRLNFIFDADCMAEAPWQERRQPAAATRTANVAGHRAAVLAYRPSAKSAAHGAITPAPTFQ
jgi:hypothetical protein